MTPASFEGPVWCSLICFDAVCTNHTMWDTNQAAFQSPGKKRRVTKRRTTNNQACNNSLLACCRRFQHTHQREHTPTHISLAQRLSDWGETPSASETCCHTLQHLRSILFIKHLDDRAFSMHQPSWHIYIVTLQMVTVTRQSL